MTAMTIPENNAVSRLNEERIIVLHRQILSISFYSTLPVHLYHNPHTVQNANISNDNKTFVKVINAQTFIFQAMSALPQPLLWFLMSNQQAYFFTIWTGKRCNSNSTCCVKYYYKKNHIQWIYHFELQITDLSQYIIHLITD